MLRPLLELCRISNLPTVWTNVLAAWIIARNGLQWEPGLVWLLAGASLLYSAGMILNDVADVGWDRQNRPERPIPSGRISLATAWALAIGGMAGGAGLMVAGGAGVGLTALLVAAIAGYDFFHKQWVGSVLVMGACRLLLYSTVSSAAVGLPGGMAEAHWFGASLGVYIVGVTLLARAESKGTVSKAARVLIRCLFAMPLAIVAWITASHSFLVWGAFAAWTTWGLMRMAKGGPQIGQAVGILLAGIPLVDALSISSRSLPTALVFCCLPPLLRLWQRWIAAT